jgi:cytochrome oxidase assembly protein ShyY1
VTTSPRHPLLGPWWVTAHLVVLAVLVTFPRLSAWQWDRYREEQAVQVRVEARLDATPRPLGDVFTPRVLADFDAEVAADLEFTPVVVTGTWRADEQVAQRNRALGGTNGYDLLTPLAPAADTELADRVVVVRRGWVPPAPGDVLAPAPDVPVAGEVEVTGWLEVAGTQPSFGPTDPLEGDLDVVFHADLARLAPQVDGDPLPMLVHLTDQVPSDGDLPVVQPPPAADPGQNLSYALQWAAFALIVGVGYAVVLVRRVRDHRAGIDSDVDPLLRDRPAAPADPAQRP